MATLLFPGNQALERWSYSSKVTQLLSGRLQQALIQCYLLHSPWAKPPCRTDIFRTMATGVVRMDWDRDLRVWAHRRGWPQSLPGLRVYEKRLKVWGGKIAIHVKDRKARSISPPTLSPSHLAWKRNVAFCQFLMTSEFTSPTPDNVLCSRQTRISTV